MFLIPFSLTLSDALGFCEQHAAQIGPPEQPVVVCPYPRTAAAHA